MAERSPCAQGSPGSWGSPLPHTKGPKLFSPGVLRVYTEARRFQLLSLSQGKLGWWTLAWLKLLVACLMDQPSQSLMPVRFRSWWKYMQAP